MTREFKTVEEVYEALEAIPMFSDRGKSAANFDLDRMQNLCAKLGNPQDDFLSIHVAGTNGKGTTCRMLASVYQSAGYKTGLFTSPHLTDFRERITVDSEWIPGDALLRFFQTHGHVIEELKPTYFELATAIGFWYFREEAVSVAVIETGLGGRLDATNIIRPIASVITSVGMDHTDLLGNTIEEIAREKAGIIKSEIPVVVGNLGEEAFSEVEKKAADNISTLIKATEPPVEMDPENQPLAARLNGGIVKAVVQLLNDKLPVSADQMAVGFRKWMGRFPKGTSFRRVHPEYRWYFDGAHNTDALKLLKQQLIEIAPLSEWTLVFGMMRDKLTPEVAKELSEVGSVYYYPLKLRRAATENEVKKLMPETMILKSRKSLAESWVQKNKSELVIFGGSFYFYKTLTQWIDNIVDR